MSSFSTFKSLEEALTHFQISSQNDTIISVENKVLVPKSLTETISFNIEETAYNVSEAAICEAIIYPVLREVWRNFRANLFLWSHKSLSKKAKNAGIPDYIIAKRSPLGKEVMDLPMLVMVEAKKDNFDEGWGQCLAQMHLAQTLNKEEHKIYGIVSNGDAWQFGLLKGNILTRNKNVLLISDLPALYNALYEILATCEQQILA